MREYGQIQCSFWTDPDVQSLSNEGKLLAAYLLSGPHSNGLGCYRLPDGYIQADFGWTAERVSKGFGELFQIGFANRCTETQFVLIPKFLKWNPITNANVASARVKEFETIPKKSQVYQQLIESLKRYGKHFTEPFLNHLETLSKGYGKQDPTQPYPTKTQSREEDSTKPQSGSVPSDELIVIHLPLNTGDQFPITGAQVEEWSSLYPNVDVIQQLRSMKGWCDSNPSKRKTKNGILRFVNSWLSREQDKGPSTSNQVQPGGGSKIQRAAASLGIEGGGNGVAALNHD